MSDNPTVMLAKLTDVVATSGATPVDKVERIRELLFGAQAREYVRRFATFDLSFTQSHQQLQQQIQQLNDQLRAHQTQIAHQLQIIEQKQAEQVASLAELRVTNSQLDRAKLDRAALGTLFAQLASTLQASVATATPAVTDWLTQLEEQLQ